MSTLWAKCSPGKIGTRAAQQGSCVVSLRQKKRKKIERLVSARFLRRFFGNALAAQNNLHAIVTLIAGVLIELARNFCHRHDSCDPISEGRRVI